MSPSIDEYAERQSGRKFKRREYHVVPADIPRHLPRIEGARAVLWDVYGTLLALSIGDLECVLARKETAHNAFMLTAREFGFDKFLDGDPALTLMGLYSREIRKTHNRKRSHGISYPEVQIEQIWLRIMKQLAKKGYSPKTDKGLSELDYAFRVAYFFDDVYQTKALYSMTLETLSAVKELGLRQGIISNAQFYTPIALNLLLRRAGFKAGEPMRLLFDRHLVLFSYRIGFSKPNPLLFEQARDRLERAGVKPSEVLYVGNDVFNDMIPARDAGFKSVLFAGDGESLNLREDYPDCADFEPDAIIKSLPDLLKIIG